MTSTADTTQTLIVERVFPHPAAKLWRALTESRLLAEWMMSNDFEPLAGHRFQFRTEPRPNWNGVIDCEVLVVVPLERLTYNWVVGKSETSAGMRWKIEWTLTPTGAGTHLRMEQSGFSPEQQANYQGAKYGWQKFFNNLERLIEGLN